MVSGWLWVIFTVLAAGGQTLRNAMQRELTATLGTVGATHVRFLFGLPFALLFLVAILVVTGEAIPPLNPRMLTWTVVGAATQFAATAMLLAAMRDKSFVLVTALNKLEPVHVALFGLVFLAERVTLPLAFAIGIATVGVLVMSWPRQPAAPKPASSVSSATPAVTLASGRQPLVLDPSNGLWRGAIVVNGEPMRFWLPEGPAVEPPPAPPAPAGTSWRPIILGIVAGAMFGASAVGYRGGMLALGSPNFVVNATITLVAGLVMQVIVLSVYLLLFDRPTLLAIFRAWRPSMLAGFMGAFASQNWFLAFALESAAKVRTLALVEILFAGLVSRSLFKQSFASRESAGIVLIIIGVGILLNL